MEKPDVDAIEGLSPAISIEQKTAGHNPRSTVGTVTEIYDYLRLLWARAGTPHCPNCGAPVAAAERRADRRHGARAGRRARGSRCSRRWCAAARASSASCSTTRAQAGLRARASWTARPIELAVAAEAQPPAEPRHRGRRRPARRARRATAAGSPTRSRRRSRLADGVVEVDAPRRHGADRSSSPSASPARPAGSRCPSSSRGSSPSTRPSAPAPTATASAPAARSTRSWSSATRASRSSKASILPWGEPAGYLRKVVLPALAKQFKFDLNAPWGDAPPKSRAGDPPRRRRAKTDVPRRRRRRATATTRATGRACSRTSSAATTRRRSDARARRSSRSTWSRRRAPTCGGRRLKPESLAVTVHGAQHRRASSSSRSTEALEFFDARAAARERARRGSTPTSPGPILKEVRERLRFLVDVGLDYLTLGRARRIALGRRGPAHPPRDPDRLAARGRALHPRRAEHRAAPARQRAAARARSRQLRDLGNTVIVVEHDEETMRAADHVIDLGPGAGRHGGEVVAEGTRRRDRSGTPRRSPGGTSAASCASPCRARAGEPEQGLRAADRGRPRSTTCGTSRRDPAGAVRRRHRRVRVGQVDARSRTSCTSALARHFYRARVIPGAHDRDHGLEHIDKVIDIDQSPIGRTPRSNPATYTGLFTPDPRALRRAARGEDPRLRARAASRST